MMLGNEEGDKSLSILGFWDAGWSEKSHLKRTISIKLMSLRKEARPMKDSNGDVECNFKEELVASFTY